MLCNVPWREIPARLRFFGPICDLKTLLWQPQANWLFFLIQSSKSFNGNVCKVRCDNHVIAAYIHEEQRRSFEENKERGLILKVKLSHLHWGWIFLTGLLVVIMVIILNLVLLWFANHIWPQQNQQLMLVQFLFWSTFVLQLLLTVGGGVWIARNVEREAPLHGLLMGLVIALIFIPFSLGFSVFALVDLAGFFLTIAAGWLGGVLGSRGRQKKLEDGHFEAM